MGYRDDREALRLEIEGLEHENQRLREDLQRAEARLRQTVDATHQVRRDASRQACVMCGGTLLPVALFAGRNAKRPVPLQVSTMRFQSPDGGFTGTAPFHTLACTSCGFLHNFLAFEAVAQSTADSPPDTEA